MKIRVIYTTLFLVLAMLFAVPVQKTVMLISNTSSTSQFEDEEETKNIDEKTDIEKENEKFKQHLQLSSKNYIFKNTLSLNYYYQSFFGHYYAQIHLPPPEEALS